MRLEIMKQPTEHGKTRWPTTKGYLPVIPRHSGDAEALPCTCEASCLEPDCRGSCGCEACWLAWLVYNDDHALWDEQGNLIMPEDKALEGPWRRIKEPSLVRDRCHSPRNGVIATSKI